LCSFFPAECFCWFFCLLLPLFTQSFLISPLPPSPLRRAGWGGGVFVAVFLSPPPLFLNLSHPFLDRLFHLTLPKHTAQSSQFFPQICFTPQRNFFFLVMIPVVDVTPCTLRVTVTVRPFVTASAFYPTDLLLPLTPTNFAVLVAVVGPAPFPPPPPGNLPTNVFFFKPLCDWFFKNPWATRVNGLHPRRSHFLLVPSHNVDRLLPPFFLGLRCLVDRPQYQYVSGDENFPALPDPVDFAIVLNRPV